MMCRVPAGFSRDPAGYQQYSSGVSAGIQQDSSRVPAGFQQDSSRDPAGIQQGSSRIPAVFQQGSSRIPVGFQQGFSRVPAGFGLSWRSPREINPWPVSCATEFGCDSHSRLIGSRSWDSIHQHNSGNAKFRSL